MIFLPNTIADCDGNEELNQIGKAKKQEEEKK